MACLREEDAGGGLLRVGLFRLGMRVGVGQRSNGRGSKTVAMRVSRLARAMKY